MAFIERVSILTMFARLCYEGQNFALVPKSFEKK